MAFDAFAQWKSLYEKVNGVTIPNVDVAAKARWTRRVLGGLKQQGVPYSECTALFVFCLRYDPLRKGSAKYTADDIVRSAPRFEVWLREHADDVQRLGLMGAIAACRPVGDDDEAVGDDVRLRAWRRLAAERQRG